jgi:uncharacterized protein (TIGR00255 family)
MTGFGAAALESGGLALRAEVRAVNHRFLQLKLRLPQELGVLEHEVEELVRSRVERGAVSLSLYSTSRARNLPAAIDHAQAKRYMRELTQLAKELRQPNSVGLETLLGLPGVLQPQAAEADLGRARRALLAVVGRALDALDQMREAEGRALAKDLRRQAVHIAALEAQIHKRMPTVVKAHQEALGRRVAELLGSSQAVPAADLAREVALLADRLDVSEELARLKSHASQLDALLGKPGSVGRQLDFLSQEFLREANTIGSKCNDAPVAHLVVELKATIERLREQVQNVE